MRRAAAGWLLAVFALAACGDNGRAAPAHRVADLRPGEASSFPSFLTALDDERIAFVAFPINFATAGEYLQFAGFDDATGEEPWSIAIVDLE